MTPAREAAAVTLGCALLWLAGTASVPFYTRGEPREGLVVREMLETGEWLVPPRPEGELARKPPLYYWLAAGPLAALPGHRELALRLPSIVLATAATLATWATARAAFGAAAGLPAALLLATVFEWTRAAVSARVDMTLAAALAVVLAAWTLALARPRRRGPGALAGAGAALGTLAKGPVAIVLPALVLGVLAVARRDRALPRRLGTPLVLAALCGAAWYAAAIARGGRAVLDIVARENVLRFVDPEGAAVGHAHAFLYLVPLALVGLLPWTPLLPLILSPLRARPVPPAVALAAAWAATGLGFFSLAAAKRSVYLLPLYPAIALLAGAAIARPPEEGRLLRAARAGAALYAPAALALAALAAALAAGVDLVRIVGRLLRPDDALAARGILATAGTPAFWVLAVATALAAAVLAHAAHRAAWRRLVVAVAALTLVWVVAFDTLVHPAIARTRSLAPFFARLARDLPADATLYALFPPDPGLRFYAPRHLAEWPKPGLPTRAYLLLWQDEWARLRDATGQWLKPRAGSEAAQAGHGHLVLVTPPPGPLTQAPPPRRPHAPE